MDRKAITKNLNLSEYVKNLVDKKYDQKLRKVLKEIVSNNDRTILPSLKGIILSERKNGLIINECVKAYFRLSRKHINDCEPLFELMFVDDHTVQESLLEVLGYDRMIPPVNEQRRIIDKYYSFGNGLDLRYFSDPRYGLAAACAGWEEEIVSDFLKNCIETGDIPVKYVAENSLKKKYVKLR